MDLAYPVLSKEFSLSRVNTEEGDNIVLYNTVTRIRAYPNAASYEFVKRCRGDKSLKEIISELSLLSNESPEKIQKDLSGLIKKMTENGMISFLPSPLHPPRPNPNEAELVRRLSSIILEITQQCNLRCKHCYIDAGVKKENELTLEEIKKLIDILTHMGVLNIMLSGGEPLLHPHLRDIIEYVRSKPLSVMVFTNGTLITEEIIQYFKEVGIAFVATSIDGATPETSDAFRGVKGSYEKTVRAIEMLKEVKIPVRVNVCLHKGILGEFEDLLALFKKWEITDYSIWPISYTGRSEREDFMVTPNEYKEVITQLKKYEFTEGVTNEFPYNPHLINCGIGRSSLTIRSDGTIVPCSPFPDSMSLGNAREDSIADIWNNSEFLRRVRHIDASISDMCKGCPHLNVCEGGCMAGNYRRTGLLECGDPFECAYFEVYDDYIPVEVTKQSRLSVEIR